LDFSPFPAEGFSPWEDFFAPGQPPEDPLFLAALLTLLLMELREVAHQT
jgi:hypothetical protein